jgi:hypothetical protein
MTVRGERAYRLLLRAYPRSFRQRFEPEMIELFAARRAAVGSGWRARAGFWRSLLNDLARSGSDPSVVGRTIQLNDRPYVVNGVMPASFQFPSGAAGPPPDLWTPIAEPIERYVGRHYLFVVGRLADGVSVPQAQSELAAVADNLAHELPPDRRHGVNVQPIQSELVFGVRSGILVLFAGVLLVLLIGCCNIANLLLVRAASRQQELAVRVALAPDRSLPRRARKSGVLMGSSRSKGSSRSTSCSPRTWPCTGSSRR